MSRAQQQVGNQVITHFQTIYSFLLQILPLCLRDELCSHLRLLPLLVLQLLVDHFSSCWNSVPVPARLREATRLVHGKDENIEPSGHQAQALLQGKKDRENNNE